MGSRIRDNHCEHIHMIQYSGRLFRLISGIACAFLVSQASADSIKIGQKAEVGSWQLRQELTTDDRGRQSAQEVRTSIVGEEERDGIAYVWVEMVMQPYSVDKKGNQKPSGDRTIIKTLVEKQLFSGDIANVFNNLRGIGKEMIMQQGDGDPMAIEEGGMMADTLLKSMGSEVNFDFKEVGREKVTTPAGSFDARIIDGSGTMEMKVFVKTIRVNSRSRQWVSDKVPFGIVKYETESEMDGKVSKVSGSVIEYGASGAKSLITKTPQKLQIPSLPFFGG